MKQYVITSPNFEATSGGVRVLYGLMGWLLAKGQLAFINQKLPNMKTVAIYPEIQEGDPLKADTVVRYILNKPGVVPAIYSDGTIKKGPVEFAETDIKYYFSHLFGKTDEDHYLFLPICNLHLFRNQHKNRNKTCFMVGKAMNEEGYRNKFIHPDDSIEITREFAQDQQALADLLNECEVLYCYDPVTALTEIARLCGCRIIMIPSIYTKSEFSKYEPGMDGINWGKDEGITFDPSEFRFHYKGMVNLFSERLDALIYETQKAN